MVPPPAVVEPDVESLVGRASGSPPRPERGSGGGPARPPGGGAPTGAGVPVVSRVPVEERVVFLTIDDGGEKDPAFLRLVGQRDLPVSAFLTDQSVGEEYGYFRRLRTLGAGIHNHTLEHPDLRTLSYAQQRAEICGQQRVLTRQMGVAPRFFRPPYGSYNQDTLRAARDCGLQAVVLWTLEAWAGRIDYQNRDRQLRPGDIILSHFRGPAEWGGTMNDMTRRVLREAREQGFTVARLEDYL
ncbi:hypothetical protein AQ490_08610 [Wenjunlia vitaminophila]|uniref:NodB homology domain-containing protein n=2 Tax=Wenjunlia vitaminophila TaxID=76728 RepID=A0A0T6LLA9_WENVI|nr:hypothetical protein AQ490_08610 [Wenjunlia vitaminophila]